MSTCKYCEESAGELLECSTCKGLCHASCLELPEKIVPMVKTYDWQCNDCKFCLACKTIENEDAILFCDSCDRGYHTYCLKPMLKKKPLGDWYCSICSKGKKGRKRKVSSDLIDVKGNQFATVTSSEVIEDSEKKDPLTDGTSNSEFNENTQKDDKPSGDLSTSIFNGDTEENKQFGIASTPLVKVVKASKKKTKRGRKQAALASPSQGIETSEKINNQLGISLTPEVSQDRRKRRRQIDSISTPEVYEELGKRSTELDVETTLGTNEEATKDTSKDKNSNVDKKSSDLRPCPFVGCTGVGNVRGDHSFHYSLNNCPLSREATKKRREQNKENNVVGTRKENMYEQTPIENIVSTADIEMFQEATKRAEENLILDQEMRPSSDGLKSIIFGNNDIDIWYKSQYALEFSRQPKLYICEFCLDYMKNSTVYGRHMAKCIARHPPGDEIYRKDNISVFEVDGAKATVYCQNLCLMAKCFLDHKTLWDDVAPFLFYIMTFSNEKGCHIIGYFSKEKNSFLHYNVSCILVLPQHMKKGYGRMLIDFSYLLTSVEGKTGSPERPLSDMGLISYRKFWVEKLLDYLNEYNEAQITVKGMSEALAINGNDIISTLQFLGMLKYWKGKHLILLRKEIIDEYATKKKRAGKENRNEIDKTCLKWKPPVNN